MLEEAERQAELIKQQEEQQHALNSQMEHFTNVVHAHEKTVQ